MLKTVVKNHFWLQRKNEKRNPKISGTQASTSREQTLVSRQCPFKALLYIRSRCYTMQHTSHASCNDLENRMHVDRACGAKLFGAKLSAKSQ